MQLIFMNSQKKKSANVVYFLICKMEFPQNNHQYSRLMQFCTWVHYIVSGLSVIIMSLPIYVTGSGKRDNFAHTIV